MIKTYNIHFAIAEPAVIAIEVEEGQSILEAFNECTTAERVTKISILLKKQALKLHT